MENHYPQNIFFESALLLISSGVMWSVCFGIENGNYVRKIPFIKEKSLYLHFISECPAEYSGVGCPAAIL